MQGLWIATLIGIFTVLAVMPEGRASGLPAPVLNAPLMRPSASSSIRPPGLTLEKLRRPVPLRGADAPAIGGVKLYGSSHALVIGNDAYGEAWPRLSNAVKDAELVAGALRERGFRVTLRKNVTYAALTDALETFFYRTGADPEARLFLWYAGHGYSEGGEGYLVPVDAPDPDEGWQFLRKALSLRRMGEYVRGAKALHILSVFDSCFAGTIFNVGRSRPPPAITRATTRPVRQFLTSGDAGQEVSDDGTFRKLFIRAINGETRADANRDGFLAASELGLFMTDQIINYTNSNQTPRNGKINDPDLDQGDFIFQVNRAMSAPVLAAPASPKPAPGGVDREALFWESIKDSERASDYEAYLEQFPSGTFAPLARSRVKAFKSRQSAALPPAAARIEELDASYVALKTANVRAEPTVSSDKIGRIARDAAVAVTGKVADGKWLRIERPGGKTGYVFASLLAPVDAGEVAAWETVRNTKSADEVAAFLRRYPSGHFAERAKRLRAALTPKVVAVTPPKLATPAPTTPAVGVYPSRKPGDVFKDCDVCPEMVVIPPGRFRMGDLNGGGDSDEKPVHEVRIDYSFAVGKYEVTFDEWDACVADGGCGNYRPTDEGWGRGERPVINVSWEDANKYTAWLSRKTGKSYRLLSESEWEFVARAGTVTEYSWGDGISRFNANYGAGIRETQQVGSYTPNGFGVHDMHGNVWEWVEDCWHGSYQGAPSDGLSWTSGGSCSKHVLRGGSWFDRPRNLRSANRFGNDTGLRIFYIGFRIARTLSR